jgi:acyl-CoA thioesterase I
MDFIRLFRAFTAFLLFLLAAGFVSRSLAQESEFSLVILGDSLSAGYGLSQEAAFPAVLETRLRARGHKVRLVNAGVSGDTAQNGLERLDWSVPEGTSGVILELGANDMLRGQDPAATRLALETIIVRLKARGIPVLLAGMRAAPNLGSDYGRRFDRLFPDLATKHALILYPFFLDGVTGNPALTLPDGLHPNAKGVAFMAEGFLPYAERFLTMMRP